MKVIKFLFLLAFAIYLVPTAAWAQLSPDGTIIRAPTGSLVTSEGTWTFGGSSTYGNLILLNGSRPSGGGEANLMEIANGGFLYVRNTFGGTSWFKRAGGSWQAVSGDPLSGSGVYGGPFSPDGTIVTAPSATTIGTSWGVFSFGAATTGGNYHILLGGVDTTGTGDKMEVALNGGLFIHNTNGNWYLYQGHYSSYPPDYSSAAPYSAAQYGPGDPLGAGASVKSQVHNAPGWIHSHAYTTGARVNNGPGWNEATGKFVPRSLLRAYQVTSGSCTSAASGGPTGTGSSITDGSCTWKYLSDTDYVTLTGWGHDAPPWTAHTMAIKESVASNDTNGILTHYVEWNAEGTGAICNSTIAPSHTSGTVTLADGCVWKWMGQIIYTSGAVQIIPYQTYTSWGAAQEQMVKPYEADLWNDQPYVMAGNGENGFVNGEWHPVLQLHKDRENDFTGLGEPANQGNTGGIVIAYYNNFIIRPAPGEGAADYMQAHPSAALTKPDQTRGVFISGAFDADDNAITLIGLQMSSGSSEAARTIQRGANQWIFDGCVIETGQDTPLGAKSPFRLGWNIRIVNSLVINHGANAIGAWLDYTGKVVHSTFVDPEGTGSVGILNGVELVVGDHQAIIDSVFVGFAHLTGSYADQVNGFYGYNASNNYTTSPAPNATCPTNCTTFSTVWQADGTPMTVNEYIAPSTNYSMSSSRVFVGANDYRIPNTSPLYQSGASFGVVNFNPEGRDGSGQWPAPDRRQWDRPDIAGTARPVSGADVGAWQTPGSAPTTATLTVNTPSNGAVTSSPGTINCGATCVNTFNIGTRVTLTATPNSRYNFTNWSGSCSGTSPTCTLPMTSSAIVTANFAQVGPPPNNNVKRGGKIRLSQPNTNPPPPTGLLEMPTGITGTTTVDVGTGPHTIDLWVANNANALCCQPKATFIIYVSDGVVNPIQVTSASKPMQITTDQNDQIQHFILRGDWGINVTQISFVETVTRSLNAVFFGNGSVAGAYYDGLQFDYLGPSIGGASQGYNTFNNNAASSITWVPCMTKEWIDCIPSYTLSESTVTGATIDGVSQSPTLFHTLINGGSSFGTPHNVVLPAGTFVGAGVIGFAPNHISGAGSTQTIIDLGHSTGPTTGADYSPAGGKAAFAVEITGGFSVSNLAVHGAKVGGNSSDGLNGAAVMFEGFGGTIDNVDFYDNQEGVRGGNIGEFFFSPIIIKNSHIHNNGSRNGFTHEIYIADGAMGGYFNDTVTQGERSTHALKSRTIATTVEGGSYSGCTDPTNQVCGAVVEASQGGYFNIFGFPTETVGSITHTGDVLTLDFVQAGAGTGVVSNAPGGASLTTSAGTFSWGAVSGSDYTILLNGVSTGGAAIQMKTFNGELYVKNAAGLWGQWNSGGPQNYTPSPGDPDSGCSGTTCRVTSTIAAGPPTSAGAATTFFNVLKANSTLKTAGFDFANVNPSVINVYKPINRPSEWTITPSVGGAGGTTTMTQATSGVTITVPANAIFSSNGTKVLGYSPENTNNGVFPVNISDLHIVNNAASQFSFASYNQTRLNLSNCIYDGIGPPLFEGFEVRGQCYPSSGIPPGLTADGTISNAASGSSLVAMEGTFSWGTSAGGGQFNILLNGTSTSGTNGGNGIAVLMETAFGHVYYKNSSNQWFEYVGIKPYDWRWLQVGGDPLL